MILCSFKVKKLWNFIFQGFYLVFIVFLTRKGDTMDEEYMKQALELAEKGKGKVEPNPMVGAVIVKDGKVIGKGYHEFFGGPHAEINAIRDASGDVEGSTIYVTLEPCCHYGKTPPCANAIIANKISRVVIGAGDPNPLVAGKGIKILREHGVEVTTGILEEDCTKINEAFNKYITSKECIQRGEK